MNRHEAREQAFLVAFEKEFNRETNAVELLLLGVTLGLFKENDFSQKLVVLMEEKTDELDKIIEENSIGWKVGRLPKVSLAVLRLAICEMLYVGDVPTGVSINEAVEIAKKYATAEDASFINGVLGTVARKTEAKT